MTIQYFLFLTLTPFLVSKADWMVLRWWKMRWNNLGCNRFVALVLSYLGKASWQGCYHNSSRKDWALFATINLASLVQNSSDWQQFFPTLGALKHLKGTGLLVWVRCDDVRECEREKRLEWSFPMAHVCWMLQQAFKSSSRWNTFLLKFLGYLSR